jgi:spore coat protein U-like protein
MMTRHLAMLLALLTCGGGFVAAQRCSLNASNVNFGSYTGSTIRMTGTLTVLCTRGALYAIGLDAGTTPGATVSNRIMTAVGDQLKYGLSSNASYTANWGNTPGTGWVTGIGIGSEQVLTVYGQVPANQRPTTGGGHLYNDNIIATLSGLGFSATARFRITANVLDACSVSATDMAFGAYSGTTINTTSGISVSCTNTTDYNVGLNAGTAAGATVTNRNLTGPEATLLHYRLSRDPAHRINWGNTVGADTVRGTGNGTVQQLFVYGQIPASQTVPPGNYSDTITVTVTF